MKLLIVSIDRNLFNPESRISDRFRKYGELFEKLDVIVLNTGKKEKLSLSDKVTIHPTNSISKFNYVPDAISIGKKIDADVVSAQDAYETALAAVPIANKIKAKLHIQIHTDVFNKEFSSQSIPNRLRAEVAKKIIPKADKIRVVSERIKRSIESKKIKVKGEIVVLPIAINDLQEKEKVELPFGVNILTVARLENEKRVSRTIQAFAEISSRYPEAGLVVIGCGTCEGNLKQKSEDFGVEDKVIFTGNTDNVAGYYNAADVYVQTSLYEGYGMTLIEAALSGLPIITTDVGIVGEVLIDGGSCLVTSADYIDISRKLEKVVSDDILAQSLGGRAKEEAENHLMSEEEYLKAFKEAFTI